MYAAFVGADPEWEVTGSLAGYDPSGRLATLAVPTLVLTGRHDRVTPPAIAYTLHRLLPGSARLVVFGRSAHRPWAEEPDAYFGTLAAFLAGAEAAPARNGTAR